MSVKKKPLIFSILIPVLVGALAGILTRGKMEDFQKLNQPPLSPPNWLFPIVWTILFILMGISCYLIITADIPMVDKKFALIPYGLQLFFNFFWSIIFFCAKDYMFAFIWLILLLVLIIITTVLFFRISKPAGYLMIPYIIWVGFAGYLNYYIYLLN